MPSKLEERRRLSLTRNFWVAAAILAGVRKAVNDPIRRDSRNRGTSKNLLNDIQGMAGELVGLAHAELSEDVVGVAHDLVDFSGPVDDVDLIVSRKTSTVRVEVKCLLLEAKKRRFLVNVIAHERSQARGADYYLPVITSIGADVAFVGNVIPPKALETWQIERFQYGDPAFSMPFDKFSQTYFLISNPSSFRKYVENARYAHGEDIELIGTTAAQKSEAFRRATQDIKDSSLATVVDRLIRVAKVEKLIE